VERLRRRPWPTDRPRTWRASVVVVSYNTAELLAHLLYSLHRVLQRGSVERIVVVENDSKDRTVELLSGLKRDGLVHVVPNRHLTYHGPGLNRGIAHLADARRKGEIESDIIWILDSDALILRPDALEGGLGCLRGSGAGIAAERGPVETGLVPEGLPYIMSMLLDARRVWQRGVRPFWEHGAPNVGFYLSVARRGLGVAEFPFFADNYVLHLGQGTIDALLQHTDTKNRYYSWATRPRTFTYHWQGNPDGAAIYETFLTQFETDLAGELTAENLTRACLLPPRLRFDPPLG
jgi:glycosyltransferase involved in cell wall biosynthesis